MILPHLHSSKPLHQRFPIKLSYSLMKQPENQSQQRSFAKNPVDISCSYTHFYSDLDVS